jgi:hypothetical protein
MIEQELQQKVTLLEQKVRQLVEDNMELHSRLEMDYNPDKPVRKLTLQEKLELNAGNVLNKFRIPTKDVKRMYYSIVSSEKEPENIDVAFDSQRYLIAFYVVDAKKEAQEIQKGENVKLDVSKIPDSMPDIQHQYDMYEVINRLTDISSNVGKIPSSVTSNNNDY